MHFLSRARKGATLVEYGILVGLISALAIGVVANMGKDVKTSFASTGATLEWYRNGATKDYPARYRFTAQQSPNTADIIGVDLDGMSGAPFGSLAEATFEGFNLRSIQYHKPSGSLIVSMPGDMTAKTSGYHMSCGDLSVGEKTLDFDFDKVSASFDFVSSSTRYQTTLAMPPFSVDQELACVIEKK